VVLDGVSEAFPHQAGDKRIFMPRSLDREVEVATRVSAMTNVIKQERYVMLLLLL
jgi:hypothetical protein